MHVGIIGAVIELKSVNKIRIYFLRHYFPYNLGDSVALSSVFKAVKGTYPDYTLEVVSDKTVVDIYYNDPFVDVLRECNVLEKKLPKKFYRKIHAKSFYPLAKTITYLLWPEMTDDFFQFMGMDAQLKDCEESPHKNLLSYMYAYQINKNIVDYPDLRPRIYLTEQEKQSAKEHIQENSIALHIAGIRDDQKRLDGERLRYKKKNWIAFVKELKKYDPTLTIYEVGQESFLGIGDAFIPRASIRELAATLSAMNLVVLSDGGVHNVCNAIDKKVLLFNAYDYNPPDLYRMHNAILNPSYHTSCRKKCHHYASILKVEDQRNHCQRECYNLNPKLLAQDAIHYLQMLKQHCKEPYSA